jgi:hypothetical protein
MCGAAPAPHIFLKSRQGPGSGWPAANPKVGRSPAKILRFRLGSRGLFASSGAARIVSTTGADVGQNRLHTHHDLCAFRCRQSRAHGEHDDDKAPDRDCSYARPEAEQSKPPTTSPRADSTHTPPNHDSAKRCSAGRNSPTGFLAMKW